MRACPISAISDATALSRAGTRRRPELRRPRRLNRIHERLSPICRQYPLTCVTMHGCMVLSFVLRAVPRRPSGVCPVCHRRFRTRWTADEKRLAPHKAPKRDAMCPVVWKLALRFEQGTDVLEPNGSAALGDRMSNEARGRIEVTSDPEASKYLLPCSSQTESTRGIRGAADSPGSRGGSA
jgi:hypothetical protein